MRDANFIALADGWRYHFVTGRFEFDERGGARPPLVQLQHLLCGALARLIRWGGWSKESVSVARHTLIVSAFTLARAEVLGWPEEQIDAAVREAAVHDLHEVLGLGDVLSPVLRWLRPSDGTGDPRLVRLEVESKIAVRQLFDLPEATPEVVRLVKLADHDAAAVERGYACADAPEWLGPRAALASHAFYRHNFNDNQLGPRLWELVTGGAEAMRREAGGMASDYLLRHLGFDTAAGRAWLVSLSGVLS